MSQTGVGATQAAQTWVVARCTLVALGQMRLNSQTEWYTGDRLKITYVALSPPRTALTSVSHLQIQSSE